MAGQAVMPQARRYVDGDERLGSKPRLVASKVYCLDLEVILHPWSFCLTRLASPGHSLIMLVITFILDHTREIALLCLVSKIMKSDAFAGFFKRKGVDVSFFKWYRG